MSKIERMMLKFPLALQEAPQIVPMPPGSVIRHCQMQGGFICLWTESPVAGSGWNGEPHQDRQFQIVATGQPFPDGAEYIGTAPMDHGSLIWHVVEIVA